MLKYTAIALNHRIFCNSTEIKEAPSELGKYSVRKSHQVNNFPLSIAKFLRTAFFIEQLWCLLLTCPQLS